MTRAILQSHTGCGARRTHATREVHDEPLGANEVRLAIQFRGCDPDAQFACRAQHVGLDLAAQFDDLARHPLDLLAALGEGLRGSAVACAQLAP